MICIEKVIVTLSSLFLSLPLSFPLCKFNASLIIWEQFFDTFFGTMYSSASNVWQSENKREKEYEREKGVWEEERKKKKSEEEERKKDQYPPDIQSMSITPFFLFYITLRLCHSVSYTLFILVPFSLYVIVTSNFGISRFDSDIKSVLYKQQQEVHGV